MNFAQAMYKQGTHKLTENGAFAYDSTAQGAMLDLFSQIGALRPRTEREIEQKFIAAFKEDKLLATKMMFYAGDIREGGLGERRTFRICLHWLAENHPEIVVKNIQLIPFYNRFDSLFTLVGTECEAVMWELVAETLTKDVRAMKASTKSKHVPVSLLAKWMPSENTSSAKTRALANKAMRALKLSPRTYRRMLSALRKHIGITERMMSAGEWGLIDYAKVPSYAMHNYGSAFAKHDHERFDAYLKSVSKGETKINSSVLFPYDLVEKYLGYRGYGCIRAGDTYVAGKEDAVVEAQWKALPNYIKEGLNIVAMADVSASMSGRPMASSIGLAIYLAQHNVGAYRNQYMTFTDNPHFINLREDCSLREAVEKTASAGVGYSTNLMKGMEAILNVAILNRVPDNEMPKALLVLSDNEIDPYFRPNVRWDFMDTLEAKFRRAGYSCPKLILWNINARHDTFLSNREDVVLVSGQSASTFKNLINALNGMTAYDYMLSILNGETYSKVRI